MPVPPLFSRVGRWAPVLVSGPGLARLNSGGAVGCRGCRRRRHEGHVTGTSAEPEDRAHGGAHRGGAVLTGGGQTGSLDWGPERVLSTRVCPPSVSTVLGGEQRPGKPQQLRGADRAHSHRCWVALPPHPSAPRVLSQRPRGPDVDGARGVGFCGVGKPPGKARRTRPRSRAGAARAQALAQEAPAVCRPRRSPPATTPTVATWLNAGPRNTPTRPSEHGALGTGVFEGS